MTRVVLVGAAATSITQYAELHHADLIVVGTHGSGDIGHMLLGSIAERVLHHARCRVMAVPRPAIASPAETPEARAGREGGVVARST